MPTAKISTRLLVRKDSAGVLCADQPNQPTPLVSPPQIVSKVAQGGIDFHRIEEAVGGDCDRAVRIRRQALERLRSVVCCGWVGVVVSKTAPPLCVPSSPLARLRRRPQGASRSTHNELGPIENTFAGGLCLLVLFAFLSLSGRTRDRLPNE